MSKPLCDYCDSTAEYTVFVDNGARIAISATFNTCGYLEDTAIDALEEMGATYRSIQSKYVGE